MPTFTELLEAYKKTSEKVEEMKKIEGNLESLRLWKFSLEVLIENHGITTKEDLENILSFVEKRIEDKDNEIIEISSK